MTAVCLVIDNSIARGELAAPSVLPPMRRDVRILKRVADVVLSGKHSAPPQRSQPCAYFGGEYAGPELSLGAGLGTGWAVIVDACGGAGWFDYAPSAGDGPLYAKTLTAKGRDFAAECVAQLKREGHRDPRVRVVWGPGYERGLTIGEAAHDAAMCRQFCDRIDLVFPGALIALRLPHPGQTAYQAADLMTVTAGRQAVASERPNVVLLDWSAAAIGTDGIHPTPDGAQALGAIAAVTVRAAVDIEECDPVPLIASHPRPFVLVTPSDGAYLPWGSLPSCMLGGAWWLRYRGPIDGLRYLVAFGAAPAIRIDSTSQLRVYVSAGPEGAQQECALIAAMPQATVDLDLLFDFTREGAAPRANNIAMRVDGVEVARASLDRDWRQLTPNHSAMILHRDRQWTAPGEIAFYRGHP